MKKVKFISLLLSVVILLMFSVSLPLIAQAAGCEIEFSEIITLDSILPDFTSPTQDTSTDFTEAPTIEPTEPTESIEIPTTEPTEPTESTEAPTTEHTEPTESTEAPTTKPTTPKPKAPALNKKQVVLLVKGTFNLKVLNLSGKRVRYTSSNTKVATVSSKGKITGIKKGEAKITARFDDKKLTCKVTVKNSPTLTYKGKSATSISIKKGATAVLVLKGKEKAVNNVYTNTKIAKFVSNKSATKLKIKGLKKGTTTLKVKVNNLKTFKIKVVVR